MHLLDIDIPHTSRPASFIIRDSSAYDESLPVNDGWLEVVPPSSVDPVIFKVEPGFSLTVNANLLHLNPMGAALPALPDGSYFIKYSVQPNNRVFQQYVHFRNTGQVNRYLQVCSDFRARKGFMPAKDYHASVRTLLWIRQLIDAAKYMAEEQHLLPEANRMYTEANSKLDALNLC